MPTHHRGSDQEVRALNAYITLMRCAASVTVRIHRHLAKVDLTIGQLGALEALMHLGPMVQHELAQKLLCSDGNLTTVLNNLERRGLVSRQRDADDRRRSRASLTGKGKQLMEEVFPRHVREVLREITVLEPAEQEALRALCRKLGIGAGPAAGTRRP